MRFCENCTDNINILILAVNSNCTPLGLLPKPFKEHFCWKNTLNWTQIRLQSHKHRMQFPQSLLQSVIYSCSSISGLCVVYFSTPYIADTVAKETSVFKQQTIPTTLISEVIIGGLNKGQHILQHTVHWWEGEDMLLWCTLDWRGFRHDGTPKYDVTSMTSTST